MADYLFIGKIIPPEEVEAVRGKMKNTMQDAALALQWNIINGLEENLGTSIDICSILPIDSFPHNYSDMRIKAHGFSHIDGAEDFLAGHNNIHYIRRLAMKNCLNGYVKKWAGKNKAAKVVFLYTLDEIFLNAAKEIKKILPDIKICCIIADLPEFINLSKNTSKLLTLYKKYNQKQLYKKLDVIDGYVLLTEQMAERLNITKPYTVMEGIATDAFSDAVFEKEETGIKQILYAGTLHKRFGVRKLAEAFMQIPYENYRLVICGVGDSEEWLKERAAADKRIIFKGRVDRKEVLRLMTKSTVIVNPRQNEGEFTKYSFPSKTMEALSSGTPFIAYKLDGIPEEYGDYIYYVSDNEIETLAEKIVQVCEKPTEERNTFAKNARRFVMKEKNKTAQTKKILEMIENWF